MKGVIKMTNFKVLSKKLKKQQGQTVVVRTVEETLTKQDLMKERDNISRRKEQLRIQSQNIKNEYNALVTKETEISELLTQIPEELETV